MYCWAMYLIQDSVFVTKILSNVSQEINQFTLTKGKYKITRGNFHFSVIEVHWLVTLWQTNMQGFQWHRHKLGFWLVGTKNVYQNEMPTKIQSPGQISRKISSLSIHSQLYIILISNEVSNYNFLRILSRTEPYRIQHRCLPLLHVVDLLVHLLGPGLAALPGNLCTTPGSVNIIVTIFFLHKSIKGPWLTIILSF